LVSHFFSKLGQAPPDLFFLLGLIKAGTTRVAVAVIDDPKLFTSRPGVVAQILAQIALLASMIDLIKRTVDAAHVVTEKSHAVHSFPDPRIIIDGFAHDENVTDAQGIVTSHELQFFHAVGLPQFETDPGAAQALRDAQNARNQGVADELAYTGVPGFEAILQDWKTVVTDPNALPVRPPTE
jgi:hypothetical protein